MEANSLAAPSIGASIDQRDETSGTVTGSRSVGLASWGERIVANVSSGDSGTSVRVESKLKFGLVDWGRNKKNVEGILDTVASQVT